MTVNTWHHCIERFGTISRTLNYYDNKTGETFFRKEVYGEASFAKRYRVNGKEHWTPFLKNPKDVLSFIKDEKAKERLHLTGYYKSDKHKFKDVYYASFENEKRKCELYQTSAGTLDHYQGTMRKYILADNLPYDTPKNKYIEDMTIMDHKLFKHTINELYHDKLSQSRIEQIFGCYNKVSKYAWQCNMISKEILMCRQWEKSSRQRKSLEIFYLIENMIYLQIPIVPMRLIILTMHCKAMQTENWQRMTVIKKLLSFVTCFIKHISALSFIQEPEKTRRGEHCGEILTCVILMKFIQLSTSVWGTIYTQKA